VVIARGRPLPGGDADVVVVDDTLRAWGDLAAAHVRAWRRARARVGPGQAACVVAITGSAGKTTTRALCAALLATEGPCRATPGNLNNRVGVPAVAFGLTPDDRFAVLEMGMSVAGEIAALGAIAPPDVALLLNVGVAHAEGVGGSRAGVAREKGALYEALGPAGVAVVNLDDAAASAQVARSRAGREATFGRAAGARYRLVERTSRGALGSRVVLSRAGEMLAVDLPLVGDAAAIDLLAALAAAEAASGVTFSAARIDEALAALAPPAGRASVVALADGTLVLDDTYNANPASMRAALATLRELAAGAGRGRGERGPRRAVAVLGEMREIGPSAIAEHEALGDAVAAAGVALLIGCGGLAEATLARAAAAGVAVLHAADAHEAAKIACEAVGAGDVVLVKGSRGVQTESVVNALVTARGRESMRREPAAPWDAGNAGHEGKSA
jgi:UDP-N-acetylmuramoyl-tripeptide--D-alanyl-D-alanine ligase